MSAKLRITLARNELVVIIGALESVIEDAKNHGGLSLVLDELALEDRLRKVLRKLDRPAQGLRP